MSGPPHVGGADADRPNAARMYDYFLGGRHNFPADREQAERVIALNPDTSSAARSNRVFLAEAVRRCLDMGITQFLDLGSGVPTAGNVHDVAHRIDPAARIAYVDHEPVAVAHARQLVASEQLDGVTVTEADLREPGAVLAAPGVAGLIDLDRPVAVLMIAVLHFVADDHDLPGLVRQYCRALVPGSALAVSHTSDDQDDPELGARLRAVGEVYRDSPRRVTLRSRAQLHELFRGLRVVEPGLVDVADWPTAGTTPGPAGAYGALGVVGPGTPPGSAAAQALPDLPGGPLDARGEVGPPPGAARLAEVPEGDADGGDGPARR